MVLEEVDTLGNAQDEDRYMITQMRENPNSLKINELKGKEISLEFQLEIPNLEQWDLSRAIESALKSYMKDKVDEREPSFF